ncbi:MAG: RNA-binding protein [Candidatus Margulisbacteria bacterium]|nr:RNA-binding protein [Candidatus Margulisiibacteriota bacterium]MBU1022156.1 RNA-binding protein [Candidatus Margulisiibacteriota bacterium]MBU1729405.1 RNA-binding protein [Candidatus Margulisiibacteriota bacterium]MBU1955678.1 RNA-binding protein [Candidatus Margulisiibacteriota bacterium]
MTKSLYVGNLPWNITSEELTAAFEAHGSVISSRIITDRDTGKSRGFAFVEVENDAAPKLIKAMNGHEFNGRSLVVNEARPKNKKQ